MPLNPPLMFALFALLIGMAAAPVPSPGWEQVRQDMAESGQIHDFYAAFARHDADAMLASYHPEVEFADPVFGTLNAAQARAMWRMLLERSQGRLKIRHANVLVQADQGQADWDAWYPFSATGNFVHNRVHARFKFKGGKIWRHTDSFDLAQWNCMALAPAGCWFGSSPELQARIHASAKESLEAWMKAHPEAESGPPASEPLVE